MTPLRLHGVVNVTTVQHRVQSDRHQASMPVDCTIDVDRYQSPSRQSGHASPNQWPRVTTVSAN